MKKIINLVLLILMVVLVSSFVKAACSRGGLSPCAGYEVCCQAQMFDPPSSSYDSKCISDFGIGCYEGLNVDPDCACLSGAKPSCPRYTAGTTCYYNGNQACTTSGWTCIYSTSSNPCVPYNDSTTCYYNSSNYCSSSGWSLPCNFYTDSDKPVCTAYVSGSTCYYGGYPICTSTGWSACAYWRQDTPTPADYYASGSTCYYGCTVSCTGSGWSRSGCSSAAGVGNFCSIGVGECYSEGTNVCVSTGIKCNALEIFPQPENCFDGKDNDCDGKTDINDPDCDATPPIITTCTPSSGNSETPTFTCDVNENAWCRMSLNDESYDGMADNWDCTGDGTKTISCQVQTPQPQTTSRLYYIACRDSLNIKNSAANNYHHTYYRGQSDFIPPLRSNGKPTGVIAATSAILQTTTYDITPPVRCKYSTTSQTYDSMPYTFQNTDGATSTFTHTQPLSGLPEGQNNYYVRCKDNLNNKNTDDYTVTFTVDTIPPTQDSITVNPWWKIDGTTTQTITLKSTESGSGVGGTYGMMALIFKDTHWSNARGYFGWSPTKYIHEADKITCSGGGYASKSTSYGAGYITLTACSTSKIGSQRTVTFTVRPNTNFGDLNDMDIAFYTTDIAGNTAPWKDFNNLFSSDGTAPTSGWTDSSFGAYDIDGTATATTQCSDAGSGIKDVYVAWKENNVWKGYVYKPYPYVCTSTGSNGQYIQCAVMCRDNANNLDASWDYTTNSLVDTVPPTQDSITVNTWWKIDGTTTQTITLKSTESGSGIGGTYGMMALIFKDTHWSNARGYFGWSPTKYIHEADRMACSGGGYASKSTSYGAGYITLTACSTSKVGSQRTVTFTVRPNTNFGDLNDMDIAFYTTDIAGNTAPWKDFNNLFSSDGTAPTHDSLTVSNQYWKIDGTTTQTITLKSTESGSGIGGTYGMMALINYQGSNAGNYRGYFSWHPSQYVHGADNIVCSGGGYASKSTSYGAGYITLVSCSTSLSGDQRTVTFTVRPNTNFGDFGAINDISMYTSDALNNYRGWTLFDINFLSDGTPPTGTVLINNGAKYTTTTSVTLTLSYSDATSGVDECRYSNDGVWDSETWEPCSATKSWNLIAGDGLKTVYYQIRDKAGNIKETSDTITIDTTLPTFISYTLANCDYTEGTTCLVKPGTITYHTIKHYDETSTPYIQYLTFTKDTCTPNACSSGNEIKSYVFVDTGTFTDWMSNNNYLDILSANCIGTCTAQYAEEEWEVLAGNTEGNFQIWTFLYDEAMKGIGYTKVGWWYKIDKTPPVRSNGQPKGTDIITTYSTTISLTTDEPATCRYSTTAATPYNSMTSSTTSLGTSHSWQVDGLIDGTNYYYIRCRDRVGNLNNNDYTITFTVNIPEVCNNTIDDDGNALIDCNDPDCIGTGIGPNGGLCCDDFITHNQCTFNETCDENLKECVDVLAGYNPTCCLNYGECVTLINEPCFPEINSSNDCPKHAVFTLVNDCLTEEERCRGYCCQACRKIGRVDSCPP